MYAVFIEVLSIVILGAITFHVLRQRSRKVQLIDKIPGPPALPYLGNVLDINVPRNEIIPTVRTFAAYYGSIFRVWVGHHPTLIISGTEYIECLLSSNKEITKSREYSYLLPWLGTGLLTSKGAKWHSRRKMLTPAFHFKILDDFVDIFNEQSKILKDHLLKEVGKTSTNIFPFITRCTLDIICESAMGRHVNAQGNADSDYVKAVYRISEIIQHRQLLPWLQPDWLFKLFPLSKEHDRSLEILHGFTTKVYREKKEQHESKEKNVLISIPDDLGRKRRLAFLDLLIETSENGQVLTDSDICEEVDTFMFEGHDTTAAGISWTLFCLSCYPEIQDKVYEELQSMFGDSDRPATRNDLQEMKYLECCIKETLRLYPSVPILARELQEEMQFGKYTVPEGTTVGACPFLLHRNPEIYPDPEEFKPERFFPENAGGRHPYAYVPFSAGPRNCIGQRFALLEEKAVVSSIIRRFRLEAAEDRHNVSLLAELILRPENGLKVKVFQR